MLNEVFLQFFLGTLAVIDYDSLNVTERLGIFNEFFNDTYPAYTSLNITEQITIVTELSEYDISLLQTAWNLKDDLLPPWMNVTTFLDTYLLDPQATIPEYVMSDAEFCANYKAILNFWLSVIMLAPASFFIILLSFVKPRKSVALNCCWGRPSTIVPINFVDEHGRRWAFVAGFAVITQYVGNFFDGDYFWYPGHWQDPTWKLAFSWLRPFILLGNVIHLGYIFFPLFACLSMRRHIPANIMGFLFLGVWVYADIDRLVNCPLTVDPDTNQWSIDALLRIIVALVVFAGELVMAFSFIVDLAVNCYTIHQRRTKTGDSYKKTSKKKKQSRFSGKENQPFRYIEHLMKPKKPEPKTLVQKIRGKLYSNVAGFKYSPRVMCTMIVAVFGLFQLTFAIGSIVDAILLPIQQASGDAAFIEGLVGTNATDVIAQAPAYITGIRGSLIFSNVVSALLHFAFMGHMLTTYRVHLRKIMRGDRSWHHTVTSSPASKLVAGMRYSGYQIAYILWGFIILFVLLAIVSLAVTIIFIIPISLGQFPLFFEQIIIAVSTIAASLFISFSQMLISKFFFLQERGAHLALTNRKAYHVVCYFFFFFNVVLGVFSVLRRSLMSLIFGTVLLCRLDRCLLMRGFERFDAGFAAYLGMLEVDATHNHPIVKGFIYMLKSEVLDSKERQQEKNGGPQKSSVATAKGNHKIDKRIRNKWWKLITLVNNPVLIIERLHQRVAEVKEQRSGLKDDLVDAIATTGTLLTGGVVVGMAGGIMDGVTQSTPL